MTYLCPGKASWTVVFDENSDPERHGDLYDVSSDAMLWLIGEKRDEKGGEDERRYLSVI